MAVNRRTDRPVEDERIVQWTAKSGGPLAMEYTGCTFTGCDFASVKLTGRRFTECVFEGCNLTLANVSGTTFNSVTFRECKLTGVRFDEADTFLFTAVFERCVMERTVLTGMKLPKQEFQECRMKEADLSGCDLTGAHFDRCDLEGALFERTNLSKADLTTAYNFRIDPEQNKLTKTRFAASGIAGLLAKYDIIIE
ncbi:MAG: pentapeptide repeat-containing protein [Bacteroidetes bacterium]|nr:pentapeptide repeat-containing protein [Bacteroidota bacterium]